MRVVLIYPPLADPSQPYPALPALAAYLHQQGRHEAVQWDVNLDYVTAVLTRAVVSRAAEIVSARLAQFEQQPEQASAAGDEYALLIEAALKAPFVIDGIEDAVAELRTWACYQDLRRLDRAERLLHEAFAILSAAAFPLRLSLFNTAGDMPGSPSALQCWATDAGHNPFRDFYAESVLPRLQAQAPDAVGISISFRSQVLGAATLALMIHQALPGVPIILGGNLVSVWQARWQELGELFTWCDYLIAFEGETALDSLLTALGAGAPLANVPNLIYRAGGEMKRTQTAVEDLDCLPTPDYAGLPLGRYLAPDTVFSLYTSRGCYWGRCAFCAVSPALRLRHRRRSGERIRADINTIAAVYGGHHVSFADDCVAPAALRQIAGAVRDCGQKIVWQAEVRFEPALTADLLQQLAAGGCANLVFGLEAIVPRVRALMNKGTANADIERILADCRRLGIAFNLQFFFGFPGEQPAEAEETAAFALAEAHGAATFSFGTFELQQGAAVARDPAVYGLTQVHGRGEVLAVKFSYEPAPAHAATARERLQRQFAARMPYRHTGLSMNAQTLFVLAACGADGLAALYRLPGKTGETGEPAMASDLLPRRLAPGASLHAGKFLLLDPADRAAAGEQDGSQVLIYNYELDATAAVSPLALWLLQQLDGSQTLAEFLAVLPEDLSDARATLADVAGQLYSRGFLICRED